MKITEADIAVCENADSFLQSSLWGEFKSLFGWKASAFLIEWSEYGEEKTPFLALSRRLIPGFSFTYIPWGPQLPQKFAASERPKAMAEIAGLLKPFLPRNNAFIRFDFPWFYLDGDENLKAEASLLKTEGFKTAAAQVQPPDTVIIDLSASCDEILASMKSKWRYNISLAEKKGVEVKICSSGDLEIFYNLLKETAQRDGIAVHGFNYYKTLFELCESRQKESISLKLYSASHEGETLAAIVVLFRGKDAVYLYGASSNNKRNLMAPYALQWKAMQDAKNFNCKTYDLFGIPPDDNPNHPMAGLYRFKTGFAGQIIHRPGSLDYPYKKFLYNLFNIAEALRKKMMNLRKKK
ncbi:MAG: peptidoglycan bridge formation glycyltransferase FemA/FemB family protein [Treponema sp.]|nr:peptidoglycan bridge formation glycyltransferase FemA/FemB family protein [Treponema sp.]